MILDQAWKLSLDTMTNVVDVYINYLRKKIDEGFEIPLIHTIRRSGYWLGRKEASPVAGESARKGGEDCNPDSRAKTVPA